MGSVTVSLAGLVVVSLLAWGRCRWQKRALPYASFCSGRVLVRARLQGAVEASHVSPLERARLEIVAAWVRKQARRYVHGEWPLGDPPCVVNLSRRPRVGEASSNPFELGFHSSPGFQGSLALQARVAVVGLAGILATLVAGRPSPSPMAAVDIPSQPFEGTNRHGAPSAVGLEEGPGSLFVASVASPAVHSFKRGTISVNLPGPTLPATGSATTNSHQNYAAWHTNMAPAAHFNIIGRHSNASNHINLDLRPLPQFPQ